MMRVMFKHVVFFLTTTVLLATTAIAITGCQEAQIEKPAPVASEASIRNSKDLENQLKTKGLDLDSDSKSQIQMDESQRKSVETLLENYISTTAVLLGEGAPRAPIVPEREKVQAHLDNAITLLAQSRAQNVWSQEPATLRRKDVEYKEYEIRMKRWAANLKRIEDRGIVEKEYLEFALRLKKLTTPEVAATEKDCMEIAGDLRRMAQLSTRNAHFGIAGLDKIANSSLHLQGMYFDFALLADRELSQRRSVKGR